MQELIFSEYILPGVLALIMVGMGLSLTFTDFSIILKHPKGLLLGLILQIVILPLIAFFLAQVFDLRPEFKVGLIIIAACPGGATSNLITHLLRGRLALSVSLTTFNSLITIFTIPVIVNFGLNYFMGETSDINMPVWQTIVRVFMLTVVPVMVGILIRRFRPVYAKKLNRPLRIIMPLLLGVVYLLAILGDQQDTGSGFIKLFYEIFPVTFLLNAVGMIFGYLSGYLFRIGRASRLTLSIEVGIQNSALAITLASSTMFLNNSLMAIPAVVYGMFTFFNAIIIGYILRKISR